MKTSIWKRFFRCGLDFRSSRYAGREAKRDANTTRTRLNRMLNKLFDDNKERCPYSKTKPKKL